MLRRLEAERLVKVEPHRGPIVARISRDEAEEIYSIREILEVLLVKRFIEISSTHDIDQLEAISDEYEKLAGRNIVDLLNVKVTFYNHLLAVANSHVLEDVLNQLISRISYLRAASISEPGRIAQSAQEIKNIVQAVRSRDPDAASQAVIAHIRAAKGNALSRLDEMQK